MSDKIRFRAQGIVRADLLPEEIEKNNLAIYELETNLETVEKYAREKYMMKRDSEDIYIMTRE